MPDIYACHARLV